MFSKILVGLDGSPGSFQALQAAVELVAKFDGSLCALSVIEGTPRYAGTAGEVMETDEGAEDEVDDVQERAEHIAAEHDVALKTITVHGHAAQQLAEQAQKGQFDLVVMGHSGHSGVWGSFIGTTAEKVSRHVACSVLIVR